MEMQISNLVDPTAVSPQWRVCGAAKPPTAGRARLVTTTCQSARLNRRSGRPKFWSRNGQAFVAGVPLNSYGKARTISRRLRLSIRRESPLTLLWHAWILRDGILPVRLRRKLFPIQPYLRRDEAYQRTRLPSAVVLRNNSLL